MIGCGQSLQQRTCSMRDTLDPPAAQARLRIGVDSGGTFTDVTLHDDVSEARMIWKVSSTPDDPARGILQGVREALSAYAPQAKEIEIVHFGHGTTVATNALIERRGEVTALITTQGFRDVLEIARQVRPGIYDLKKRRPTPLATRDHRHELRERIAADGTIQQPLDETEVRALAARLRAEGVTAIAVCLINSYRNPVHEQRVGAILRGELPGAFVSLSTEIAPEYREYERSSTAVVNAYVGPVIRDYLARLRDGLCAQGITVAPFLTQSNGGVLGFDGAAHLPVRTILSGPAAGVTAACAIAEAAGCPDVITFDMGGTSTDVALIQGARARMATETEVHGHPLRIPMLDIETVGAGGGSIATLDAGHLLEVGPESAGAFPGPACYQSGNDRPTVTDANVVLQVLNPDALLAGRMPISQDAARAAIARLAAPLGLSVLDAATGIIDMAVANMVRAVRVVSIERGHDPRDFTLMAFGGAGPVHATRLARELGMRRVLVPPRPGVLCSLGLLMSDLKTSFAATRPMALDEATPAALRAGFAALEAQAQDWFADEGAPKADRSTARAVDLRYAGQGHELTIPCPDLAALDLVDHLRQAFDRAHETTYGYAIPDDTVQLTTLRLDAVARVPKVPLVAEPHASTALPDPETHRAVWLPERGGWCDTPVFDRDGLAPGHVIPGPAIVEQMDSTTLILPGQTATVDFYLNLLIEG